MVATLNTCIAYYTESLLNTDTVYYTVSLLNTGIIRDMNVQHSSCEWHR